ncbi:MAG: DUF2764 family protein [bacterium]
MDRYYYLVAQLPTLVFEKKSGMTIEYFLEQAEKWVNKRDIRKLKKIDLDDTSFKKMGVKSYRQYQEFEYRFRKGLADYRKSVKKSEESKKVSFPEELVKEGDPLSIEKKLLRYRWDYIDELTKEHDFDLDALILYYLKLQIKNKLSVFNKEKGLEVFHQTVDEKSDRTDTSQKD